MSDVSIVNSKDELKAAIKRGASTIVVQDSSLASNIKTVKMASKVALGAAIAGAGLAASNFWNPVGWVSGVASVAVSGSLVWALVALGLSATLIWLIYNDYSIKGKGKVTLPDGTEVEGEIILEKD